jgi:disulfide oxidoreductase YuzD
LTKDAIEIDIIDDTSRRDCNADCGTDWSTQEAVDLASQQIKGRFGAETRFDYIDLSCTTPDKRIVGWQEAIKGRNLSVPLLVINNHLRIAGQFDIRQIIDAIEVEMELGK